MYRMRDWSRGVASGAAMALLGACGQASNAVATLPEATSASAPARVGPAPAPAREPAAVADAAADAADDGLSGWTGHYEYLEPASPIPGGNTAPVTYTLDLTPDACRFSSKGEPVSEGTIRCRTDVRNSALRVMFGSFEPGGGPATRAEGLFSPGDTLFVLRRTGGRLVTEWQGYPLADGETHRPGTFFHQ